MVKRAESCEPHSVSRVRGEVSSPSHKQSLFDSTSCRKVGTPPHPACLPLWLLRGREARRRREARNRPWKLRSNQSLYLGMLRRELSERGSVRLRE